MRKKLQLLLIVLLMGTVGFAQNNKTTWPEMKKFHSMMAATFHPTEEGNFAPLKAKADSLVILSSLWLESAIPSTYKAEETKKALISLSIKCHAILKAVIAKFSDDKLKILIGEAHEIFHKIIGECVKPGS